VHHTPLKLTLTSQTKHTPTDIIVHLPFTFQSMHTHYWICVFIQDSSWHLTSKHIQDPHGSQWSWSNARGHSAHCHSQWCV